MAQSASPEPRSFHESALIDDELHLFGGANESHYFPRNEIWTCNIREGSKWICRFAEGKNIPPPCQGAQCVVINKIIYSYGGMKEDKNYSGDVFALDPKKMKWIKVVTPSHQKKPWQRSHCCLWAIGGRMIMFGGLSERDPHDLPQPGARFNGWVNNEIYEFVFEGGTEKGFWLDVELSGERPQPRHSAAMETIDQHRGLLHGGKDRLFESKALDDAFVIDLREKNWHFIVFFPIPSPQCFHRICRLGFEEKNFFIMIGGYPKELSDGGYILDIEHQQSHKINLTPDVALAMGHTLHCVANQDGTANLIICGGDDDKDFKQMMKIYTLGPSDEPYMEIETILFAQSALIISPGGRRIICDAEEQIYQLREQCETLQVEKSKLAHQYRDLQEQVECESADSQAKRIRLDAAMLGKESQCRTLKARCQSLETEKNEIRTQLHAERRFFKLRRQELESKTNKIRTQLYAQRQAVESQFQLLDSQLQIIQESFDDQIFVPNPYEDTINPSFKIGDTYISLSSRMSSEVSEKVTAKGIFMTIAENKAFLSVPLEAVDDPIVVSARLLTDNGKYKSKNGAALTDVVQLRPHGTKLQKAVTLKLKHNFAFTENHAIKVTLLYQSGTDLKNVFRPLCFLTALNEVVSFRFGYATLLADQIIVKTTSFCYICGENNGCCMKLSELVFAPTDLSPSQFRQGFAVKLCICEASEEKEDKVIRRECERTSPHAFEMIEKREFSLCECGISKDSDPPVLPIVATIKKSRSAAAWSIDGSYKVDFRQLRAIFKGDSSHQPYYFEFSLSDRSLDFGDRLTVRFVLQWKEPIDLLATFKAKNPELSRLQRSLSFKESLESSTENYLDRMVTEDELHKVAKYFPDDWKDLARELKVDVKMVEAVQKNEPQEHPHNMLKLWRRHNGTDATVRLLCKALLDVKHRLAAEMVFPDASKRLMLEHT